MFEKITSEMEGRMKVLEDMDEKDRKDGTSRLERLRQIPPETGRFLAILAAASPSGNLVEVGTSAGYSTLWLSLAAQARHQKVITFELLEAKIALAKETFAQSQVTEFVDLREGDAIANLDQVNNIAFCFLDTEKELYFECYRKIIPKLVPGGILVCDNAINHYETLKPMIDLALNDARVDAVVVAIGKGELLCRKR